MGQINEEQLKLENETSLAKREHKQTLEKLSQIKGDVTDLMTLRDKITREIEERNAELTRVQLEINEEKLNWIGEKQGQIQELNNKFAEADTIIKRKAELNEQEEKIRKIEANDIEIRNETARLKLEVEGDRTAVLAEKRILEDEKKELSLKEKKIEKDILDFKNKVVEVLKQVEKI